MPRGATMPDRHYLMHRLAPGTRWTMAKRIGEDAAGHGRKLARRGIMIWVDIVALAG